MNRKKINEAMDLIEQMTDRVILTTTVPCVYRTPPPGLQLLAAFLAVGQ